MIQLEVIYPSTKRPSPLKELHSVGASVPIGTKGKVYVRGQNNMATSQKLGISWLIMDPDRIIAQEQTLDWEFGTTGPGDDHQFIGREFDIDKPGDWTITIVLWMNPDDMVMVDSYSGVLCVVEVEVPPVPPEEKKFPWTLALIGGGAVIAIAGLAAAKRR